MYTIEKLIKCTFRWQFCFSSSINRFKVMNKNVPKIGQNIAISVKFHETVKLIVRLVWIPFTCLNTPAGLCKFYAWPENQLDSFKYYVPIWRVIWRLVHHMTMYGLSAWSAWIFTPGYRLVSVSWPGVTFRTGVPFMKMFAANSVHSSSASFSCKKSQGQFLFKNSNILIP